MQNIEDKIRKLLALAAGSSEHEAALAAEKASELALQYNIDLLELQAPKAKFKNEEVYDGRKAEQWVVNIIAGVSLLNAVKYYTSLNPYTKQVSYRLIGAPHNIEITKQISLYLINAVKRLNREYVKNYDYDQSMRSAYRKAFRLTASKRLYKRLEDKFNQLNQSKPNPSGHNALVVANYFKQQLEEIHQFSQEQGLKFKTKEVTIHIRSREGEADGNEAGKKISLNDQLKQESHHALPGPQSVR